jgi:adenosylcobinamide kinase/adenosylcobinamide-phosphate guanylyltransferase
VKECRTTLILGGARSGKSRHAESLAEDHDGQKIYIASGEAGDEEMHSRIARHREQRGPRWTTIEVPTAVVEAVAGNDGAENFILIDCVTLWVANLMHAGRDVAAETGRLARLMPELSARLVIVSNEVGLGIVPDNALARAFRDAAGKANQALAGAADEVLFIAAGLPLKLK